MHVYAFQQKDVREVINVKTHIVAVVRVMQ
jgi:hypothetical protein